MTVTAHALLIALTLSVRPLQAETPPPADGLSKEYAIALSDLRNGKERLSIAHRLRPLVEKHSASSYAQIVSPFLADLTASAVRSSSNQDELPERRIAETRIPFQLLKSCKNLDDHHLKAWTAKDPLDPVSKLVTMDRQVITRLIPLLTDSSPARCGGFFDWDWSTPQARVCDVALALIEYHGDVRFSHDSISGLFLHRLPATERDRIVARVTSWWREVKDKSIAAGVRAQLSNAQSYAETIWMARNLARIAGNEDRDDRQFAINTLRDKVKENPRTLIGAYAADALAELGDTSAVDIFHGEWKSAPGLIHDSHIASYLCSHGRRREWELLHTISLKEISDGKGLEHGVVWTCAVTHAVACTNPYAIPILGLALGQTEMTGHRQLESGAQSFSYADTACELLQKQVGVDFGYRPEDQVGERLTAIRKAESWWEQNGKSNYSFDFIELRMVARH